MKLVRLFVCVLMLQGWSSSALGANSVISRVDRSPALRTDALILAKDGKVLVEEYQHGYQPKKKHRLWSITKSVGSLVVAIAVKEERIKLSDSVCDHLSQRDGLRPEHCSITINDLLYWQSGIDWTETDFGFKPHQSNLFHGLYGQGRSDLARYFLSLPVIHPAGQRWKYTTAESHLLWKVLRKVYSESEYHRLIWTKLFEPLGIRDVTFEQDQSGTFLGGSHLYMTPRDLLKVAHFVLSEYEQASTLPDQWMQEMTTPKPHAPYSRWSDQKGETPAIGAGHWWVNKTVSNDQEQPWVKASPNTFAAFGVFGQMMILVPEEKIVIIRLANDVVGGLLNRPRFVHEMLDEVRKRSSSAPNGSQE